MESNLAYAYTVFHMVDTAAYRYNWDGTTYPAVSEYGGEIGKWASNARNEKHDHHPQVASELCDQ